MQSKRHFDPMKSIKLSSVKISGFATRNMLPGEEGFILVRAKLTSSQPEFHLYMRGIDSLVVNAARTARKELTLDHTSTLLLLIRSDDSADLYLEPIPLIMEMLAKDPIKEGQIVYRRDIADLRRIRLQDVKIGSTDRIIYCFKVGWKFGLFFDLGQNRELDIDQMELDLAHLRRLLVYENEYEATSETAVFDQLTQDGWFPFIEIIGGDFDDLLKAYKRQFAVVLVFLRSPFTTMGSIVQ